MTAARRIQLHPMNHLFIVTRVLHLLPARLVSHQLPAHRRGGFASLAVSTGLMAYYCFLTGKDRVLLRIVLAARGYSSGYSRRRFFFPEHTGFLITVASIVAFIGLMRATAGVDWEDRL